MGVACSRCRWVRDRLPLLAGGELTGPDRRAVERHLITCAGCRDHERSLAGALAALRGASAAVEPSRAPSLWPALARQIRESKHERPARAWAGAWWAWPEAPGSLRRAAVAAGALAAVGLAAGGVALQARRQVADARAAVAAAARPIRPDLGATPDPAATGADAPAAGLTVARADALAPPLDAVAPAASSSASPVKGAGRLDYDLDRGTPMGDGGEVKVSY